MQGPCYTAWRHPWDGFPAFHSGLHRLHLGCPSCLPTWPFGLCSLFCILFIQWWHHMPFNTMEPFLSLESVLLLMWLEAGGRLSLLESHIVPLSRQGKYFEFFLLGEHLKILWTLFFEKKIQTKKCLTGSWLFLQVPSFTEDQLLWLKGREMECNNLRFQHDWIQTVQASGYACQGVSRED